VALVHLSECEGSLEDEDQGYLDHVAFRSRGLPGLLEKLESHEIDYQMAYLDDRDMTQVFFRAPSNTRIEVNFIGEKV
jgi:hypothetical protein